VDPRGATAARSGRRGLVQLAARCAGQAIPARLRPLNPPANRHQSSSWRAVEQAFQKDDRLRPQLDQLVGTAQGSRTFDAELAAQIVLPLPDEVGNLEDTFERRYGDLDGFLAANEIAYAVIWPLPGLTSGEFPILLEQNIEVGLMSDEELTAVLNTGVLRPSFPGVPLVPTGLSSVPL
jgi:hypothetical protein